MKKTIIKCPKCSLGQLCWKRKWFFGAMELRCEFTFGCRYRMAPDKVLSDAVDRAKALERKLRSMTEPAPRSTNTSASKAIKEIIFKFHPDRNPYRMVTVAEVVVELNRLKDLL